MFAVSELGWINQDIYLKLFDFFINSILPARPVLLIQDGHGSHISTELVERARTNDMHLLCLPSHTTHLLQPLWVCLNPLKLTSTKHVKSICRIILVGDYTHYPCGALTNSLTPLNIISGLTSVGSILWIWDKSRIGSRHLQTLFVSSTLIQLQQMYLNPNVPSQTLVSQHR